MVRKRGIWVGFGVAGQVQTLHMGFLMELEKLSIGGRGGAEWNGMGWRQCWMCDERHLALIGVGDA